MKTLATAILFCLFALAARAQQPDGGPMGKINGLQWQQSTTFRIADIATVALPSNVKALGPDDTSRFVELLGNPPFKNSYAISAKNYQWFAVFSFNPSGYVKDDEKIDPDALLATLKEQNKAGDVERKRLGLNTLSLQGWYVPPHYDVQTKRLEWGTKLLSDDGVTVNYTTRLLGRSGVMSAVLVSDPETLEQDVKSFHALLQQITFVGGQRYEEFRLGDKVAEYGLAALIVGGAAAVAVKAGGGVMKAIVVGILALVAGALGALKRLFRRKGPAA